MLLLVFGVSPRIWFYSQASDSFKLSQESQDRPLIGIFSMPLPVKLRQKLLVKIEESSERVEGLSGEEDLKELSFFPSSYAKWVQDQGADVLPIDYKTSTEELTVLMSKLHGILLTGGATELYSREEVQVYRKSVRRTQKQPSTFSRKIGVVLEQAKKINTQRTFPIWGTCLGFEAMVLNEVNYSVEMKRVNNLNSVAPIKLVSRRSYTHSSTSQLEQTSPNVFNYLSTEDVQQVEQHSLAYFNHLNGFTVADFAQNEVTSEHFEVLATTLTVHRHEQREIVAAIRHKKFPFFGVQFHPEKAKFESGVPLRGDPEAQKVADLLGRFFVDQARESSQQSQVAVHEVLSHFEEYEFFKAENVGQFDQLELMRKRRRII